MQRVPLAGLYRLVPATEEEDLLQELVEERRRPQTCFLLPTPDDHGYLQVSVLSVAPDAVGRVDAVVALSPPGDLAGLTPRDLEVLGLLVEGRANAAVAQVLGVTPRTVATHIEHVLLKLDADPRTLAAFRAQRRGRYVPPALLPGHSRSA